MTTHTPGPWKMNTAGCAGPWPQPFKITEIYVYAPDTQDDVAVCSEIIDPVTQEPSEANARLIAAAPDLLEHLRHTVRFWDQLNANDIETMRALIARATGETT